MSIAKVVYSGVERLRLLGLVGALTFANLAYSQVPDAGALQRQLQREAEQLRPSTLPNSEVKITPAPSKPSSSRETIEVKKFSVSGVSLVSRPLIEETLAPFENRELTFDQIRDAANAITALYTQIGRTAKAVIPPQDVINGNINIHIIEGKVGKTIINLDKDAPSRIRSSVIQQFVNVNNSQGEQLDLYGLERSIALLNELPGNNSSGELAAGDREESTDILVSAKDTGLFTGRVDLSNYGSASTGSSQAVASLNLNNPFRIGDQVSFDTIGSQGSVYGQLKYGLPIGADGWRISAGMSALEYKSIPSFSSTVTQGNAQTYGLYSTYALQRTAESTTNLVINFENKNYNNSTSGVETSRYQLNDFTIGISGNHNFGKQFFTWGVNAVIGNLSIGNTNQINNDQAGATTSGSFAKLTFNGSLTTALPIERTNASFSVYGQLANKNLNTAEQLYLGGPYGVRAYPVAQGGGAQGAVASLEINHTYANQLQLGVFFDAGLIQQYVTTWDGWQGQSNAGNTYPLYATGLSAKYSYEKLQISAAVAFRIGDNPLYNYSGQQLNVDNVYRSVQGWIKVTYYF